MRWLTRDGLAAALAVGGAVWWGLGWPGIVLLFAFFLSGSLLTQWAAGPGLSVPDGQADFGIDLYFSGTSFFTLGLGDVIPHTD